ncbi:MAG: DUF948 domain-containing protein [Tissierellia bacterium]|nr:DUF948 domain-containing protein [Tissierellia bacterium]
MDATITVKELLNFILYILGIGVLAYLIAIIRNANKIIFKARKIIEDNEEEIDTTLKQLPDITTNVNDISEDLRELIEEVSPEITGLTTNVNSITERLDTSSEIVLDAVDTVSESVAETALHLGYNVRNAADYIELIMDIIEIIKNAFKGK